MGYRMPTLLGVQSEQTCPQGNRSFAIPYQSVLIDIVGPLPDTFLP